MPSSCSSTGLNSCAACGPSFYLFYFEASTSQAIAGHLHEGVYYKNFNRALTVNSYFNALEKINDCIGDPTNQGYSGTLNNSAIYNYEVDEFGNIAIYVTGSTTTSASGWLAVCCAEGDAFSVGYVYTASSNGTIETVSVKTRCNPTATETTETCNVIDPEFLGLGCGVPGCSGPNLEGDCGAYYRCEDDPKHSSPIDLQFINGLCQSSVSTKIGILTNNRSQNCNGSKCGNGDKDDCWGFYSAPYFFLNDNNLDDPNANSTNSQKLKFKMATIKEGFDKTYKSVSGKLKFYYGGTGGKTPCCNDDFDGTVLKETGYSISAGSTFKNNYLASDAGDIDNSDQSAVGEAIYICSTVDSVEFI